MGSVATRGGDPTPAVRPGRKRSEDSRIAIVSAAWEAFAELGYPAVTTREIATRAGCGRQTIFRWWPTKSDVLLEALVLKADTHVSVADTGDLDRELRAFLADSFALGRRAPVSGLLCALMAEAQTDAEFGRRFRDTFLTSRRDALATVLARAVDRGELSDRVRLETLLDIVFGVIWYRMLATREPLDDVLIDELVAVITSTTSDLRTRRSTGKKVKGRS